MTTAPDWLDGDRLAAWLAGRVPAVTPPLRVDTLAGGRSNLTCLIGDAEGRRWILRRPPLGHVLATAHDVARELRIISALQGTAVPVPGVVGVIEDAAVAGAEAVVMEFVDGHVLRVPADAAALSVPARARAGEALVDALVALHQVDLAAVGLDGLARPDGYIQRQLKRWSAQVASVADAGGFAPPELARAHDLLSARVPEGAGTAIVHGDYRLDNVMVGEDGDVRAVLDWELCTLGDPLADLGLLLVYWTEPGDAFAALGESATTAEGFPGRDALVARYAQGSGRDVSRLSFYVAFGYWKLASILVGVHHRFASGAHGEPSPETAELPGRIALLAQAALAEAAAPSV